jgi:hypothetical protein
VRLTLFLEKSIFHYYTQKLHVRGGWSLKKENSLDSANKYSKEVMKMTWIEFLIALAIFFILATLSERILRKKYQIVKRKGWRYEPVNLVHKRAERILFWGYLIIFMGFIFAESRYASSLIFGFLLLIHALRAYMEWKHERKTKEYLITANTFCWFFVFSVIYLTQLLEK